MANTMLNQREEPNLRISQEMVPREVLEELQTQVVASTIFVESTEQFGR